MAKGTQVRGGNPGGKPATQKQKGNGSVMAAVDKGNAKGKATTPKAAPKTPKKGNAKATPKKGNGTAASDEAIMAKVAEIMAPKETAPAKAAAPKAKISVNAAKVKADIAKQRAAKGTGNRKTSTPRAPVLPPSVENVAQLLKGIEHLGREGQYIAVAQRAAKLYRMITTLKQSGKIPEVDVTKGGNGNGKTAPKSTAKKSTAKKSTGTKKSTAKTTAKK